MTIRNPVAARWALFSIFLVHGLVIGAWVPHIPLAKERLDVGPGVFGLALLCFAGGAILSMPLTGVAINRFGSARMTTIAGALFCLLVLGPVLAGVLPVFALCALLFGMSIGSMDVSMNAHGIAIEKALGKPVMSALHGAYSLGGMAGAFAGAALLQIMTEWQHALIASALGLAILLPATRFLLPTTVDMGLSGDHFVMPTRTTVGLGLLCYLALMTEGSVLDWSAIHIREAYAVDAGTAALAFALFSGGMAVSRFLGDWLRLTFGAVRMVTVSSAMTVAALVAVIFAPWLWLAVGSFVVAGVGIGNVAPVLFAGGGRLEPDAPGRGIAAVTTLGYAGFLSGPPVIGFAAEAFGLANAFWIMVAAMATIAFLSRHVRAADTF
jgi:MFS family permease